MLFRKKPVIVEAVQWKGETAIDAMQFLIANSIPDGVMTFRRDILGTLIISIKTLEGEMKAMPGDWVIRGCEGEYYSIKPGVFEKTYTAVEEAGPYETDKGYKGPTDDLRDSPLWRGSVICPDCGRRFIILLQGAQLVRVVSSI